MKVDASSVGPQSFTVSQGLETRADALRMQFLPSMDGTPCFRLDYI